MSSFVELGNSYLAPVLAHYHLLEIKAARGCYVLGIDGKKYLDCASGIASLNVGHCHPTVVKAVIDQAKTYMHVGAGVVYYDKNVVLAQKLVEVSPFEQASVFFCQSGTEAIEASIKLVKYVTGKQNIVSFIGQFHGRSLGALSVTHKPKFRKGYEPLLPGVSFFQYPYCYRCPYGLTYDKCGEACVGKLEEQFDVLDKAATAAVIFEPVMGEGGYVVPPMAFVKRLRELTQDAGILLIFDEIQTGFGRTGAMFACEHFEVVPDVMALAKSMASGLPLGACIAKKELMDKWSTSSHGSTFSGNPVSCAAALATLAVIDEEKLIQAAYTKGQYLKEKLIELQQKFPVMGDVRGLGMMIAVEFIDPVTQAPAPMITKMIKEKGLSRGIVFISCGSEDQCLRIIPPLTIDYAQLDQVVGILVDILSEGV